MSRPFSFVTLSYRNILLVLLTIDVAFILANVMAAAAKDLALIGTVPPAMKITEDRSIPEFFNYFEWFAIVAGLAWISLRDRWLAPLLWAFVFLLVLADDSLQLHEQIGRALGDRLDFGSTLIYGNDIGEIAVFAAMGAVALAFTLVLMLRRDRATLQLNRRYFLIVLALGFFGVGVDALHSVIAHLIEGTRFASVIAQAFGLLEDGGEMVVASFATALTLAPEGAWTGAPA